MMKSELAPDRARERALGRAEQRLAITRDEAIALVSARGAELDRLCRVAAAVRDEGLARRGTPRTLTYSRKVFVPLTTLCRDRCHYCVFVDTPNQLARQARPVFQSPETVLEIARAGAAAGCREVLFTLGDRPEARWPVADAWLRSRGYASTLDYVSGMAALVHAETGLLPHINPGVMTWAELERLRPTAPSMGMMLETTSRQLWSERGSAHYGSPDKDPALRLRVLEDAGRARVPFSTGILLGIGEGAADRVDALLAIRASRERWGHIQEVIVQNYRAKPATAMRDVPDFGAEAYRAAIAVARLLLGPDARVQVPPNLSDEAALAGLIGAGIDDWGGVSPVTPDHVNPERPWPELDRLAHLTERAGYRLRERLTAHAEYLDEADGWVDPALHASLRAHRAAAGIELIGGGTASRPPGDALSGGGTASPLLGDALIERLGQDPGRLSDREAVGLLGREGAALRRLTALADELRRDRFPELTFVRNRVFRLGDAEPVDLDAITAAAAAAERSGASEAAVLGAPSGRDRGAQMLAALAAIRAGGPGLHIHGFRPAELVSGAASLGLPLAVFLGRLARNGLDTVAGTGLSALAPSAEVAAWFDCLAAAHRAQLPSTAALRYGRDTQPTALVALLRRVSEQHRETGGFTEFIAMPRGGGAERARDAAGFLDRARAVTAVARLLLHDRVPHVQAAWPDLGLGAASAVLRAGADDLGGTLLPGWGISAAEQSGLDDELLLAVSARSARPLRQRDTRYEDPANPRPVSRTDRPRPLPESLR